MEWWRRWGYTRTVLGASVTPGQQFPVTVGAGGVGKGGSESGGTVAYGGSGGSGICIIRWDNQKS